MSLEIEDSWIQRASWNYGDPGNECLYLSVYLMTRQVSLHSCGMVIFLRSMMSIPTFSWSLWGGTFWGYEQLLKYLELCQFTFTGICCNNWVYFIILCRKNTSKECLCHSGTGVSLVLSHFFIFKTAVKI